MIRVSLFSLWLLTTSSSCTAKSRGLAFVPSQRLHHHHLHRNYDHDAKSLQLNEQRPQQLSNGASHGKILIANEWGIPDSETLEPLSPVPVSQLDNGGKVSLVGSGPGDPDLLTLSAYRLLCDPEIMVIADRLVSDEIMALIVTDNVKVARKLPGCAELAQEEIFWWTYQGLQEGKHVVRLKIGDPFVFGRGGEEVIKFRQFGVEPVVIPGISSAFAAPLLGAIPVTHRGVANQVVMCTGYGRDGTSPDLIRYHKEQTVVFLMAVGRLQELCDNLINLAGYPSKTPVAIVERAGCPNQRTVVGNMETIAGLAKLHNVKPPSTIVVGEVVHVLLDTDQKTGEAVTGLIQNYTAIAL